MPAKRVTLKALTRLEEAAITYQYFNDLKNWTEVFCLCHDTDSMTKETILARTSAWKNSDMVQAYLKALRRKDDKRIETMANGEVIRKQSEGEGVTNAFNVDYTDFPQLIEWLKGQINGMPDEKDKQTYLKMLIDIMGMKGGDRTDEMDVMRTYMPLMCRDCKLYEAAEKGYLMVPEKEKEG